MAGGSGDRSRDAAGGRQAHSRAQGDGRVPPRVGALGSPASGEPPRQLEQASQGAPHDLGAPRGRGEEGWQGGDSGERRDGHDQLRHHSLETPRPATRRRSSASVSLRGAVEGPPSQAPRDGDQEGRADRVSRRVSSVSSGHRAGHPGGGSYLGSTTRSRSAGGGDQWRHEHGRSAAAEAP
eukprot:4019552-Pyramimonas_sp.AAC.1